MCRCIRLLLWPLLLFSLSGSLVAAALPGKKAPIELLLNDWSSQRVMAYITGALFQRQGYRVSYIELPVAEQWGALRLGQAHVQVEVWEGSMGALYERLLERGVIVDAGNHRATTREEWWYPLYVEELCPGLPDWRALPRCARLFATEHTYPRGRYLTGFWEMPERARVRALGLGFDVERVSTEQLWLELEAAVAARKPILMVNWEPNWVSLKYPGRYIEFPRYEPACEQDPAWGVNPEYLYDCGNPTSGWLKKIAWAQMPEHWPCAYRLLQQVDFDSAMLEELVLWTDLEGLSDQAAAKRWLEENESLWRSWLALSCQQRSE